MKPNTTRMYRYSLACYFGLILVLLGWYVLYAPPQNRGITVLTYMYISLLFFLIPGLIRGNRAVFFIASYLVLIYFTHAVMELYANADVRWFAAAELLLSILIFLYATLYIKYLDRETKENSATTSSSQTE